MTDTLTALRVVLPLCPARELSPNAREHWASKARAVKTMRRAAWACAHETLNGERPMLTGPVLVDATIGWAKGRKTVDPDNAVAMLKSAIDGLTDAGLWANDREVTVVVGSQATWGSMGAATQALYPAGFITLDVYPGGTP